MFARPICPAICGSGTRERSVRWKDGSGCGAAPFSVVSGLRGSGKRGSRPGDVGGSRWVFVRGPHHWLPRLASTLRISVACVGQVDIFSVGVPDRQALLECVARPCVVGLYQGSLWARLARSGSSWFFCRVRSHWCDVHRPALRWEEVIPQPSCRLLPFAWPLQGVRACAAVRRCCRSCGRVQLRDLGGFPRVAQGRCGGH